MTHRCVSFRTHLFYTRASSSNSPLDPAHRVRKRKGPSSAKSFQVHPASSPPWASGRSRGVSESVTTSVLSSHPSQSLHPGPRTAHSQTLPECQVPTFTEHLPSSRVITESGAVSTQILTPSTCPVYQPNSNSPSNS